MRLSVLLAVLASLTATGAGADGALLSRLAENVGAPQIVRPTGETAVVGVLMQSLAGQAGRVTTFGQVFRRGDWPEGRDLVAEAGSTRLKMQADIKARHSDGSVRHAVLSIVNPNAREAQVALRLGDAEPVGTALDLRDLLKRGYDLQLDMDFSGRVATLDVASMLQQAIFSEPERWLRGPLATEIRLKRRLTPQLTAIFDVRMLADGAARTAISVHNDAMFDTGNSEISYRYAVRMSGQTLVERTVEHRRYTNWREIVWAGAQPSAAHVVFDYPYMIAAGAVPAYDPELRLDRKFVSDAPLRLAERDTDPFGNALIEKAMPTTGGRADIGMLPDWTLAWLRTQSPQHRRAMMETAEAAGSVPWHLRDPQTQRVPTLDAHPKYWMDYRASEAANGHGPIRTKVDGWKIDNAHQPDLSYVPYLITGDRYFLDEMHAQVAAGLFRYDPAYRDGAAGNLRNDEVRGQAWVNRTHAYAAWITPDGHPQKSYLTDKLRARLAWYAREYPRNDKLGGPARLETSGWIQGANPKGIISNWQQDFFSLSLAQAARMGFAEAGPVYQYTRRYHLNRMLSREFHPRWATGYHTIHGDRETRAPFATWQEIATANLADGRFEANPQVQNGDHDKAWNFAAQGRAGYAALVGAFADPLIAEAYARLARETLAMSRGNDSFARYPKWGIVPVFPDGTTLALANHRGIDGRGEGNGANELLAGGPGADMLLGEGGNDIVAGFDGDDLIAGGDGFNLLAGGRGNDRIVCEGGLTLASGGPGADVFYFGRRASGGPAPVGRVEIVDFRPGEDRLALPPGTGDPASVLRGARATPAGARLGIGGGSVLLRGIDPVMLRPEMLAMR